ncbi:hypothetical protein ACHAXR_000302, partial [Thalassiosira sp. AJA248-18]
MEVGAHYSPSTHHAASTKHDLSRDRLKRGQCPDCGIQTHKKSFFRGDVPINDEFVLNGRCLACKPLPLGGSSPTSVAPAAAIPPAASSQGNGIEGGDGDEDRNEQVDDPEPGVAASGADVHPPWWKRYKQRVIGVLALVSIGTIAIILGVKLWADPPKKCFNDRDELRSAVERYIEDEDCANNSECQVGQTYGWPMNS